MTFLIACSYSFHKTTSNGLELCGLLVYYFNAFISCLDSNSECTEWNITCKQTNKLENKVLAPKVVIVANHVNQIKCLLKTHTYKVKLNLQLH